ncbi:MAG: hypothetical protein COT74_13935 [Bdellovibrionales bacterium CG10_big_fil_rev_8_21_14_0_10_45_34]|nr:MAG: hypothetical protein COT74_13935 [Bdellovibrionales bacterium CG10_big_fil_rev_8_21_14_0_10_45_34]
MARPSVLRSAQDVIESTPSLKSTIQEVIDVQPIPKVFEYKLLKPLLVFYCWFKHTPFLRIGPEAGVGEEVMCLAQKVR